MVQSPTQKSFYSFGEEYVRRLTEGDAETERHFVEYFTPLLMIKLRYRLRCHEEPKDFVQETFLRVLQSLRHGPGLQKPEGLGKYVNSTCNYVVLEHWRDQDKYEQWDPCNEEPPDPDPGILCELITKEMCRQVRSVIDELSRKDRLLLKAIFLEERDKDEVCQEVSVRRKCLPVCQHRALKRALKRLRRLQQEERRRKPPGL